MMNSTNDKLLAKDTKVILRKPGRSANYSLWLLNIILSREG